MNCNRLKGIIVANGDRQKDLAEAIGLTESRLNLKINGKRNAEFSQSEIKAIIERYDLSSEETIKIFFT